MKVHEYQAKEIFDSYHIPTPKGSVAFTSSEAEKIAKDIGNKVVVKAQVHTGGRGKAGGVKLANNPTEAKTNADKILGMDIKGFKVKKVLVVEAVEIEKEYYLGLILDRTKKKITFMFSEAGGMDIEEVAAKTPEKIIYSSIDSNIGFKNYHANELFSNVFKEKEQLETATMIAKKLYDIFIEKDCSLVEINPLAILKNGKILACDAKMNFDDNALYRHPDLEKLIDLEELNKNEVSAAELGLSYVQLDGNVGCIVNGAGLAMATMDCVMLHKGSPSNFLDVGGSSDPKKVIRAIEIITSDKKVKSILFNIFGGITRCDDIAKGLVEATKQIKIDVPIIVRLTGTNEAEAREILKGTNLITAKSMEEVVKLAVDKSKN